ncbi:MAG: hypothetical protein ACE5KM_13085 [Planctomycetaceae bacterium]
MPIEQITANDIERQRQEAVAELEAESGPDWDNGFEPGTHGGHELLDRVSIVMELLESRVVDHPACLRDPAWYQQAEQAAELLRELYQQIGAAQPDDDE